MLTRRTKNFNDSVCLEQKRIKLIMLKKIKEDPRLIRRLLPDNIYKIYKFLKRMIIKNNEF